MKFWMDFFRICHKWLLPWGGVWCRMAISPDLYPQGHSTVTLEKKLLKYCTTCAVGSTAFNLGWIFFPYLAHIISKMWGCVVHNDLCAWPTSSMPCTLGLWKKNQCHHMAHLIMSNLQHMQSRMCSINSNGIRGSGDFFKNGTFQNLSSSYRDKR